MGNLFGKSAYTTKDLVVFLLFSLYLILKPFYFWSSGLPQISDFIILLLAFYYVLAKGFRIQIKNDYRPLINRSLIFVCYIMMINLVWTIVLTDANFMRTSLFYIYNFFVIALVCLLVSEYDEMFLKLVYASVLLSCGIQLLLFLTIGYSGTRETLIFNNPNQLGYYALLIVTLLICLSHKINVKASWFFGGLLAAVVLALASLSKAAIVSSAGLIVVFMLSKHKKKRFMKATIVLAVVSIALFALAYHAFPAIQNNILYVSVQNRIYSIGKSNDDNLEGRGYLRLIEYPQYTLLGAGEGGFDRFSTLTGGEFHSTLGNILLSYGAIGFMLFIRLILAAIKSDKFTGGYVIAFILLYGLTHNGMRNTFFWILLALIAFVAEQKPHERIRNG